MAMGQVYGSKMSVTRDKVHEYLGMDLDYTGNTCVKISMIKYVDRISPCRSPLSQPPQHLIMCLIYWKMTLESYSLKNKFKISTIP